MGGPNVGLRPILFQDWLLYLLKEKIPPCVYFDYKFCLSLIILSLSNLVKTVFE